MSEKIRLTAQTLNRLPEADQQNVTRFCPKCGRVIPLDQHLCAFCGNTGKIPRPKESPKRNLTVLCAVTALLLLLLAWLWLAAGSHEARSVIPVQPTQIAVQGTALPVIILP